MAKNPFACSECHLILADGIDQCTRHPSAPVSSDWSGYVVVMDPTRSEIASRLKIEVPGNYALKVNSR
ncbi:MAG: DNA-directed RNA polymerase subunit E'' [Euryarchaeota archaeon]|jgi:DNA-directed RNA polymerase subunit E"|nr:DNA-directed RNA polymerase subunit E'' [Euryarchaeota archaeon]MBT4981836.1 DNA-directed RNA polymerase subunit E'' [Euryarchaeota archaeon]MBT5184686.1 DNA-directed RNA polymerase subunit E'' [Euryarchaeota archaeon]